MYFVHILESEYDIEAFNLMIEDTTLYFCADKAHEMALCTPRLNKAKPSTRIVSSFSVFL